MMKFHLRRILLAAFLVALTSGILRAELPPEAQAAMKKGITAAQLGDYPLALRFFQDARKAAPDAPQVYYNLGLAESKISGRELRAIAWFGAYLAAAPAAPNAAAVKDQIDVLEVRHESNTSRLLDTVRDAVNKLPDDRYGISLVDVAEIYIDAGDSGTARKIIEAIDKSHDDWTGIARAQERLGDLAGARKTLTSEAKTVARIDADKPSVGLLATWATKIESQMMIAGDQARIGDLDGAQATLKQIENKSRSSALRGRLLPRTLADLAVGHAKAGNVNKSREFQASAQRAADAIKHPDYDFGQWQKCEVLSGIAEAQAMTGDYAASNASLGSAQMSANRMTNAYYKSSARTDIAELQLRLGDMTGLKETLSAIEESSSHIEDPRSSREVQNRLANLRVKAGFSEPPGLESKSWIERLDDSASDSDCALNTPSFLDLAEHLKSLPTDDPRQLAKDLVTTAANIVSAENLIRKMLGQQAQRDAKL